MVAAAASFNGVLWVVIAASLLCLSLAAPGSGENGRNKTRTKDNNLQKFSDKRTSITATTPAPMTTRKLTCEQRAEKQLGDNEVVFQTEIQDLVDRYHNWGELLAPAPLAISILGQLILMSNQIRDFPIDDPPPTNGFQHVERPKSFRSTLLQISHSGHGAFRIAHNNMKEIRVRNSLASEQIAKAVKYLMSKNQNVIKLRLPSSLERIKSVADSNTNLTREIQTQFQTVLELIHETSLAVISTRTRTEIEIHDLDVNRTLTLMEQQFSEEETSLLGQKVATLNATFQRLNDRQQNIMIRTLYGDEDFTINLSKDRLSQTGDRYKKHPDKFFGKGSWMYSFWDESVETNVCAEQNSQQVMDLLAAFNIYRAGYAEWQKPENQHRQHFDGIQTINTFERIIGELYNCPDIEKIAEKGANLIRALKRVNFPSVKKTDSRPGLADIEEITLLVKNLRAAAKVIEKSSSNSTIYQNYNLVEIWEKSFQHQYGMIEEMANATKKIIEINVKQMEIRKEKTKLILERIANLDVSKVHYAQVLKALEDGFEELSKLKEDWDKLLRFFGNVKLFIEAASQHIMAVAEIVETLSWDLTGLEEAEMFRELLEKIEKSNEAVLLVHGIADMYVNVSDAYIMNQMASLDTLNTLKLSGPSGEQLKKEQAKLRDNAMKAFEGISQYVKADEKKLLKRLEERHKEINVNFNWVIECQNSEAEYHPMDSLSYNWFQLKSRLSSKVLDVPHETKNIINLGESTYVHMWDSHGGDNQLWFADDEKIIRAVASGFCLTSKGYFPALVAVEPCENGDNQRWTLVNNTIVNLDNTKNCLHIPNQDKKNGAHVTESKCRAGSNMLWDPVVVFKAGNQPSRYKSATWLKDESTL